MTGRTPLNSEMLGISLRGCLETARKKAAVRVFVHHAEAVRRLGDHKIKFWRRTRQEEPQPDPLALHEVATVLEIARLRFPEWYPFLLRGLRTGMRLGGTAGVELGRRLARVPTLRAAARS